MGEFVEPVAVLEDLAVFILRHGTATAAVGVIGAFLGSVGVLAVDILEVFGHVVKHSPVFFHFVEVFDVAGEVALGGGFELLILGKDGPDVDCA